MRLIDADELKKLFPDNGEGSWTYNITAKMYIDNALTVEPEKPQCNQIAWEQGYEAGLAQGKSERPKGECKTCKYYHPYCKQFSNEPRGDGYCVIARMTSEGMTTINCNDEFGCSDYQKGGAE